MSGIKSNTIDVRADNRKLVLSVFLRTLMAAFMNGIIYISILMLVTGLGTKRIGTEVYEVIEEGGSTSFSLVEYIPSEAATTAATTATAATSSAQSTAKTSSTGTTRLYREVPIHSKLSPFAANFSDIVSQILMLLLFGSMAYSVLWTQGDKDANHVQFGHMQADRFRGLKIGAVAALPSILIFLVLVLWRLSALPSGSILAYRFENMTFWPLVNLLTGGSDNISNVSSYTWVVMLILLMAQAILPLITHAAYTLGYRHISIMEKFIYVNPKKKKKCRR